MRVRIASTETWMPKQPHIWRRAKVLYLVHPFAITQTIKEGRKGAELKGYDNCAAAYSCLS